MVRLVAGFAGVSVVLVAGSAGEEGWSAWALVVVAASVAWAAGTLWASRSGTPPRPATVVQLCAGGLTLVVAGFLAGELPTGPFGTASWVSFGYLVLVDSLAGSRCSTGCCGRLPCRS